MSDLLTDYATLFGAAASVATAVGVWYAFLQYKHSVLIAKESDRRASIELAARESTNYGADLLPGFRKLRQEIEDSGCQFFQHFKLLRQENDLKSDASAVTEDDYKKLNERITEIMRVLNSLEGFAIPFVAGVADGRVGFVECGHSFVCIFEEFFGLYARSDLKRYYPSTQILYWKWRKQIEKDERGRMLLKSATRQFFALTEAFIHEETNSKVLRNTASWLKKKADKE